MTVGSADSGDPPARIDEGGEPGGLATRVARGAMWIGSSYAATQGIAVAANVALAHFLLPRDFGLVAMANLMLAALGPFHDSGLLPAFVARTTAVRAAAATIAWTTPITGLLVCGVAMLAAPLAAWAFAEPHLTPIVRVLALGFFLRGLSIAPLAIISKELAFRAKAGVAFIGALAEGVVAIALAAAGFGYWALIVGQLVGGAILTLTAWWVVPWRPRGPFVWRELSEMARFGRHIIAGNLLGFLGSYVDSIAVGRWLGGEALGLYGLASRWGRLPPQALATTVNQVAFPSYVAVRADPARFRSAYLRIMHTVSVLALPASIGLAIIAPALVRAVYPPSWEGAIGPLQAFALFGLVNALVAPTGDVFKAANRPGWIPGLAVLHLPVLTIALWLLVDRGPVGAALALVIAALASGAAAIPAVMRILGITPRMLVVALAPQTLAALTMGATLLGVRAMMRETSDVATLITLIGAGVLTYAGALRLMARDRWRELVGLLHDVASAGAPARAVLPGGSGQV